MHLTHKPVAVVGLLAVGGLLAGCGSDKKTLAGGSNTSGAVHTIEVTLTDNGCEPASLSALAGPTTFHVTNDGAAGVTEFEVLSGSKILGEVENVTPGIDRSFSLTLAEGSFVTYCPGGKTEKGTLEVAKRATGSTGDAAARAAAVTRYLTYVKSEADNSSRPPTFVAAVKASDVTRRSRLRPGPHALRVDRADRRELRQSRSGDRRTRGRCRRPSGPASTASSRHLGRQDDDRNGTVADQLLADVTKLRTQIDSGSSSRHRSQTVPSSC